MLQSLPAPGPPAYCACWPPGSACARRLLAQPRDALSPVAAQEFRHVCGHTATSWGDASTKHVRPSSGTKCLQPQICVCAPPSWRVRARGPHSAAECVWETRGTSFLMGKKQGMQNLTGFGRHDKNSSSGRTLTLKHCHSFSCELHTGYASQNPSSMMLAYE